MQNCLQELRKKAGYRSAQAFADRLGVSRSAVSLWEAGMREMTLEIACNICDILHCTLDELAGRPYPALSMDERRLMSMYRNSDERGRMMIQSVAMLNSGDSGLSSEGYAMNY